MVSVPLSCHSLDSLASPVWGAAVFPADLKDRTKKICWFLVFQLFSYGEESKLLLNRKPEVLHIWMFREKKTCYRWYLSLVRTGCLSTEGRGWGGPWAFSFQFLTQSTNSVLTINWMEGGNMFLNLSHLWWFSKEWRMGHIPLGTKVHFHELKVPTSPFQWRWTVWSEGRTSTCHLTTRWWYTSSWEVK